jgi:hypothetical protein
MFLSVGTKIIKMDKISSLTIPFTIQICLKMIQFFSMKFSRGPKSLYSDDQLVNDMLGSGFDYSILPACGTLGWDHGPTCQQPRPPAPHINHLPRSARPCLSRPPLLLPAPLVEPWSSCLRPFPARHLFPAAARPGTPFSSSFPNQGELGFFHHSHC